MKKIEYNHNVNLTISLSEKI